MVPQIEIQRLCLGPLGWAKSLQLLSSVCGTQAMRAKGFRTLRASRAVYFEAKGTQRLHRKCSYQQDVFRSTLLKEPRSV